MPGKVAQLGFELRTVFGIIIQLNVRYTVKYTLLNVYIKFNALKKIQYKYHLKT